jgi:hypothetical protein
LNVFRIILEYVCRDRESRPCQLCLSIQTRLPLKPEMQSSLEATEQSAIKHSPLETILGLSAKSAELGWISRPLPYHLCMPIYEHSVISGREYISRLWANASPLDCPNKHRIPYNVNGARSLLPTIKLQPFLDRNCFDASGDFESCDFVKSFRC